jgi:NTP pyrophosphatase (non-canonical NTP hydrolase)
MRRHVDSLDETLKNLVLFRDEREWERFHTPRNLAAALAIEVSELQEALLWKSDEEVTSFLASDPGRRDTQREIADVLIYALLLCHGAGIDPILAIGEKLAENAAKYPVELSRGQAVKYTRLRPNH